MKTTFAFRVLSLWVWGLTFALASLEVNEHTDASLSVKSSLPELRGTKLTAANEAAMGANEMAHRQVQQGGSGMILGARWINTNTDQPPVSWSNIILVPPTSPDATTCIGPGSFQFFDGDYLPSSSLSIEATSSNGTIGSVQFKLNDYLGSTLFASNENNPRWAMCGNLGPDFFPCSNSSRLRSAPDLFVSAFSGPSGTGALLSRGCARLAVFTPEPPDLVLLLIDADLDRVIRPLDMTQNVLPGKNYNIQLDYFFSRPRVWTPNYVVFDFDNGTFVNTERVKPFAAFGNNGTDFFPFQFSEGNHTLTITIYKINSQIGAVRSVRINAFNP